MKKLKFRKPYPIEQHKEYQKDIQRIVSVCKDKGYELSEEDAIVAWEKYSEDYFAAGWLVLPKNDDYLFESIMKVMEEE